MKTTKIEKKPVERRKQYPVQVLILTLVVSLAQFFGIWFIHLAMTKGSEHLQWTPLLFQVALNFGFAFLLISMAYRSFHLTRMVSATNKAMKEENLQHKFTEATLRLSRDKAEAANNTKTAYLANVSHEFRTPMNSIVGFSEILLEEELTEEQRDYAKTIYVNSRHLLEMINNVLDLSKLESRKLEIVSSPFEVELFIDRIDKIMRPTAEAKGLEFEIVTHDLLLDTINADEMHLRQCLINLLANAVKFTDSGSVMLRVGGDESMLRFDVVDTGIGISEDKLAAIFEPFAQADQTIKKTFGGTGLGLAITRELVEMMDGNISVESIPGVGATFTIELPNKAAVEATV